MLPRAPEPKNSEDIRRVELTQLYLDDFEAFAEDCLRILTKSGQIQPLVLNKAQQYLHRRIEDQLRRTGKVRIIILKGRQQGCSTYTEARFYWKAIHSQGVRVFILTHEIEATKNLFAMADRFHQRNPYRPEAIRSSANELFFGDIEVGYGVGTAGNQGTGRSKTIQLFHGSEVAHWQHADKHKAGAMQAIPDEPGTEVILESTAHGVGGMFYDIVMLAQAVARGDVDASGQKLVSDYELVFIPWYWQDEYRADPPAGFKRTEEEQVLAKLYGLDDKQLAWRRKKISDLKPSGGGNREDLFKQEYPFTVEEAFLFSGRMVFTPSDVAAAHLEVFDPKMRAEFVAGKPQQRADGRLRIWQHPKPSRRYVIGADVAEGLPTGDYSCADVLEVGTGRQVAQWHGHIAPDLFGVLLFTLGNYYNGALLGVESNNHGLTVLTKLRDLKYRRLYVQEDLTHRADKKETKKLGWLTTVQSKLKIIDQLSAELRDKSHGIACEETILEIGTYIINKAGEYTANEGRHDDRVMSRAIAGEMLRHVPTQYVEEVVETKAKPKGWVY